MATQSEQPTPQEGEVLLSPERIAHEKVLGRLDVLGQEEAGIRARFEDELNEYDQLLTVFPITPEEVDALHLAKATKEVEQHKALAPIEDEREVLQNEDERMFAKAKKEATDFHMRRMLAEVIPRVQALADEIQEIVDKIDDKYKSAATADGYYALTALRTMEALVASTKMLTESDQSYARKLIMQAKLAHDKVATLNARQLTQDRYGK